MRVCLFHFNAYYLKYKETTRHAIATQQLLSFLHFLITKPILPFPCISLPEKCKFFFLNNFNYTASSFIHVSYTEKIYIHANSNSLAKDSIFIAQLFSFIYFHIFSSFCSFAQRCFLLLQNRSIE